MRLNSRVEIVKFDTRVGVDGYRSIQVAVDSQLSWPFDIHEADFARYEGNDAAFAAYLERTAMTLIHRYGDARKTRIREDGAIVPLFGEDENETATAAI